MNIKDYTEITLTEDIEEKYQLYDKIISATYTNILNSILIEGEDGVFSVGKDVIFSSLANKTDYVRRVFQKVAFMVAEISGCKVAIDMNIFQFIYYRYIKGNRLLRWKKKTDEVNIFVGELATFEAKAFDVEMNVFEKIWNAYYERNK